MVVVPDSIEPVVGWKGLNSHDGLLHSPSHSMAWERGVPTEAFCHSANKTIRTWRVVPKSPPDQFLSQGGIYPSSDIRYAEATDNWVYMVSTWRSPLEQEHLVCTYDYDGVPDLTFAEEVEWSLEAELDHGPAPAKRCSCGLYMAAEPTFSYGTVVVELYGWGTVIPGTQGFRCQYAYPKRIFVPDNQIKERKGFAKYGVPVLPFEEIPGLTPEPDSEQIKGAAKLMFTSSWTTPKK